ncbi:UBA/THIF-type NAD/FAD binding fold [Sulfurimonas denitrificans DSM 1251]|uniref:UBA/THIF-type NAD/FAD binding fold n=1 Tax=Sulfurimonas denitrificans (strain ATCC 33889 / DSM 1251) TaxID=326298 RepID=Q30SJ1_SULDN|nr:ThiF family adenylyltransferase [Sulfurimonas denitrificans]ABB44040.1 UBA/THIF-type NAD/FAD binding fold [Sulfurimonas denitrificans DSM 1251]MDD3443400.1 ThiF family adenylyltransferase [Sulfurimonas denitrificans]
MMEYFHRQVQLWGEETQNSLQSKKIAIVGAGGLGSSLCFALGASGIGEIHVIDFDKVSTHNIHRQIAFKLGDEGKNKAEINAQILEQRCAYVKAIAHDCTFEEWCKKNIAVDLLIDATDNLNTRAQIDDCAIKRSTPWIYGSVEAFHGQICFFENSSFRDAFKINSKTPEGITAPIVMHVASLEANLALRYLAGFNVKKDQLYYLFFNNDGELVTQKFSLSKSSR